MTDFRHFFCTEITLSCKRNIVRIFSRPLDALSPPLYPFSAGYATFMYGAMRFSHVQARLPGKFLREMRTRNLPRAYLLQKSCTPGEISKKRSAGYHCTCRRFENYHKIHAYGCVTDGGAFVSVELAKPPSTNAFYSLLYS